MRFTQQRTTHSVYLLLESRLDSLPPEQQAQLLVDLVPCIDQLSDSVSATVSSSLVERLGTLPLALQRPVWDAIGKNKSWAAITSGNEE
ncbi:hypothetical protein [Burkholderia sp. Bp8986]|uniref:hypothetical protein n=1 Tax=Burkholderia sp. Bp8986 TaxID=2184550 RepID=UPI000F5B28A0|nr:hypothetical protein [Burkholderia sp. Bp8986]